MKGRRRDQRELAGCCGFAWQDGYGACTVSKSSEANVKDYIARQQEHHRVRTFQEEYLALLRQHGITYDERYVWD